MRAMLHRGTEDRQGGEADRQSRRGSGCAEADDPEVKEQCRAATLKLTTESWQIPARRMLSPSQDHQDQAMQQIS
jgi:hypothetical protein